MSKHKPEQMDLFDDAARVARENKRQSLQVRMCNLQDALSSTLPRDVDTILYIERQIANTARELEELHGNS